MKGVALFCILAVVSIVFGSIDVSPTNLVKAAANNTVDGYPVIAGGNISSTSLKIDQNATNTNNRVSFSGKVTVSIPSGYHIWDHNSGSSTGATNTNKTEVAIMKLANGASAWQFVASDQNVPYAASADKKTATITVNQYDNSSNIGDAASYVLYVFLQKNTALETTTSTQAVIPISTTLKYTPAPVVANIELISGTFNNGQGSQLTKGADGTIEPKLSLKLGSPFDTWNGGIDSFDGFNFDSGVYQYRICNLTVTYSGGGTLNLLNTNYSKDQCNTTSKLINGTISNGLISIPSFPIKPANGSSSFTADLTYMYYINNVPLYHQVFTLKSNLGFKYNATTGVGGSTTSAANNAANSTNTAANGQAATGTGNSVYDQCLQGFNKSWTPAHIVEYNVIGKPLCTLIDIIVSFSTDLATYAITYFLKPALGLS